MTDWIVGWPTWEMIRTLGITSYVLLCIGICLGIAHSMPIFRGKTRANLYRLHTGATIGGTVIGLLHGAVTVIDAYLPYSWSGVLIPFAAGNRPFLSGLGTLAAYGLLIVIFTSDIRSKLGRRTWRLIHMLSYPIWIMALLHGLLLGSDSGTAPIRVLYIVSAGAILSVTLLRIFMRPAGQASALRSKGHAGR
ncbi:ferric reductase-like transmembrane domain-containing protein [Paenibacillus sp. MBLB4367]|uniref:ferric reductase-like transmembrane domain-containing protein n=1 Tax=Paenibacillus sp. MBLB4367 TaxID=3384767 RepID=UPI003907FF36